MPAHRQPHRAIVLNLPSDNPYSLSNVNRKRQNVQVGDPEGWGEKAKGKAKEATTTTTTTKTDSTSASNVAPLVGKPVDGGSNTSSTVPSSDSGTAAAAAGIGSTSTNPNSNSHDPQPIPIPAPTPTQPTELHQAQASTAQWNSLLIWARNRRGPQWDAATGMWQVDRDSREYYTFCSDPSKGVETTESQLKESRNDDDVSPPPTGPGRSGRGRPKRDKSGTANANAAVNAAGVGVGVGVTPTTGAGQALQGSQTMGTGGQE